LLMFSSYLLFIFLHALSRVQLGVGSVQNYVQFSDNFHVHDFFMTMRRN
jgi:hypothetical protein